MDGEMYVSCLMLECVGADQLELPFHDSEGRAVSMMVDGTSEGVEGKTL